MPTEPRFESMVERQITEAAARGEFDELPGSGAPLDDLDAAYDPEWWAKRFVRRERAREEADELRRILRAELPRLQVAPDRSAAQKRAAELNEMVKAVNEALPELDRVPPIQL